MKTAALALLLIGFALPGVTRLTAAQDNVETVALLIIDGAIGPATTDYLVRGIAKAHRQGAQAVILQIDTPGGLDAATRDINQAILAAPIPVISYVYPQGARAASAGTYILYASHVAAMAPATNLGAATPVNIIGGAPGGKPKQPERESGQQQADESDSDSEPDAGTNAESEPEESEPSSPAEAISAMERKAINDSVAYIRGLAEKHGRNADWAEAAVREAVSLSSSDALEQNVIDLVANNRRDLLTQLDGRELTLSDGSSVILNTAQATIEPIEPDWRNQLLSRITDPTVAYLLFIIGIYGLLLEGYNPGALVPGVIGAICLLLALYAFQVLPINYVGLGLILLGLVLIVAEAFAPSFGVLGIGGIVALTIGSVILIDADIPGLQVSRTLIATIAVSAGGTLLWIITKLARLRKKPSVIGTQALVGAHGEVIDASGRVHVAGEDWLAESAEPLSAGEQVEILSVSGLKLTVRKHQQEI